MEIRIFCFFYSTHSTNHYSLIDYPVIYKKISRFLFLKTKENGLNNTLWFDYPVIYKKTSRYLFLKTKENGVNNPLVNLKLKTKESKKLRIYIETNQSHQLDWRKKAILLGMSISTTKKLYPKILRSFYFYCHDTYGTRLNWLWYNGLKCQKMVV